MSLDQAQQQHVLNWLKQHVKKGCPSCGGGRFGPGLCSLNAEQGGAVPVVTVTCSDCAHVRLFSAVRMGLPSPAAPPTPGGPA